MTILNPSENQVCCRSHRRAWKYIALTAWNGCLLTTERTERCRRSAIFCLRGLKKPTVWDTAKKKMKNYTKRNISYFRHASFPTAKQLWSTCDFPRGRPGARDRHCGVWKEVGRGLSAIVHNHQSKPVTASSKTMNYRHTPDSESTPCMPWEPTHTWSIDLSKGPNFACHK